MNEKTARFTLAKTKPLINISMSIEIHEAIKVYAYNRQMRMREATEHLIKLALWQEMHKGENNDTKGL